MGAWLSHATNPPSTLRLSTSYHTHSNPPPNRTDTPPEAQEPLSPVPLVAQLERPYNLKAIPDDHPTDKAVFRYMEPPTAEELNEPKPPRRQDMSQYGFDVVLFPHSEEITPLINQEGRYWNPTPSREFFQGCFYAAVLPQTVMGHHWEPLIAGYINEALDDWTQRAPRFPATLPPPCPNHTSVWLCPTEGFQPGCPRWKSDSDGLKYLDRNLSGSGELWEIIYDHQKKQAAQKHKNRQLLMKGLPTKEEPVYPPTKHPHVGLSLIHI